MPRSRRSMGRGHKPRRVNTQEPLPRFLIICEGERTEPAYFAGFRVPSVKIKIVGAGKDPLTLVQRAVQLRQKDDYDQVWCVFDRDDVSPERFEQALSLAKQHGVEVACSNQAFEVWYLLHFYYFDTPFTRDDYLSRLNQQLGRPYKKADTTLYQELLPRQEDALQNATRLESQYEPRNLARDDPATTVHKLVRELNRFTQDQRFHAS